MARYKLNLKYDGTDFYGFQRQKESRTVQEVVELALKKINWTGKSILSSGRTDRGVHADGHIVTFDHEWKHSIIELQNAINAYLPLDVSVTKVTLVENDFHPRFDAKTRTYHYFIYFSASRNPIRDRYAWRIWPEMDMDLLMRSANCFIGEHDFSSIGRSPLKNGSTVRNIEKAIWESKETFCKFVITGNSFLYHMVRRIVYLQVKFAFGDLLEEELIEGIRNQKQLIAGIAPANGLFLHEVCY